MFIEDVRFINNFRIGKEISGDSRAARLTKDLINVDEAVA
jgi:hypothetical protein